MTQISKEKPINLKKEEVWELLKELDNYCYICKKYIFLFCGQSKIKTGGCCVGYEFKGQKWMTSRYAHISCYLKPKLHIKSLWEKERTTTKMLKKIFENKLETQQFLLEKEPLCKGKWRKEEQKELKKIKEILKYLRSKNL